MLSWGQQALTGRGACNSSLWLRPGVPRGPRESLEPERQGLARPCSGHGGDTAGGEQVGASPEDSREARAPGSSWKSWTSLHPLGPIQADCAVLVAPASHSLWFLGTLTSGRSPPGACSPTPYPAAESDPTSALMPCITLLAAASGPLCQSCLALCGLLTRPLPSGAHRQLSRHSPRGPAA